MPKHLNLEELKAGFEHIKKSPKNNGEVKMIVLRPRENERKVLNEVHLDIENGVEGDCWIETKKYVSQVTIMNARALELIAPPEDGDTPQSRWPLAGDQLIIDIDLSESNMSPGTKFKIGNDVELEVTTNPHRGCNKFNDRFGKTTRDFFNSEEGIKYNLRGIHARILKSGKVKIGDCLIKL